jgi:hypothetical protein
MPASTSDIAAGTRRARIETWSDAGIKSRYPSARDGGAEPAEGFFDSAADGAAVVAFRGALFGVERRRFAVEAQDLLWPDPASGLPIVQLTDAELAVNGKTLPAGIEVDPEAGVTRYGLVG